MKSLLISLFISWNIFAADAIIVPHDSLQTFTKFGNTYKGISTPQLKAQEIEVWDASIAPGSATPIHVHSNEEIIVLTQGTLRVWTENGTDKVVTAPATLILPANVKHQLTNVGEIPSRNFAIIKIKSDIFDQDHHSIELPWRK